MHRDLAGNADETGTISPGLLVLEAISALEATGIRSVYLRNYENLPGEVGNDVDLLVPSGRRAEAIDIMVGAARRHGWEFLNTAHFGPIALYLANLETGETLHIDVFDRLEWHFIEFADAGRIIAQRRRHVEVMVPAREDEIYLNLLTRLAYQGAIREKHRGAAREFVNAEGPDLLRGAFESHLGPQGKRLFDVLLAHDWNPQASDRRLLLTSMAVRHGLQHPLRLMHGAIRYGMRTYRKIIHPPGKLIVLEGPDGVGKSTILENLRPWCGQWCAGRDTYGFHWKPMTVTRSEEKSDAVNPRASGPRPFLLSLAYLSWHLLGFWWGWFFKIRPLLVKSHAVVGDRYSYDIFMDPARFRLGLPRWLCKLAARSVPQPAVTVGLEADPQAVHTRKPELSVDEIATYQKRWRVLAEGSPTMVTVAADAPPPEVLLGVKRAILQSLISRGN
ncbi:MAG: hypothetical protein V4640_02135 [Verrucomicrobiota bacterium]